MELRSKLAYSIPNILKKSHKRSKDQLNFFSNQELVYKISCDDYPLISIDASYVGQTKRQLKARLQKHRSNIKKKTRSLLVITNYRVDSTVNSVRTK